ncbi:MAG TPA: glycosyl hydrolase [Chloroflexota bacterium]|nr:glycosyl hydrolase [Chloroflexota bacterium]
MTAMLSVGGTAYTSSNAAAEELLFGSVDGLFTLKRTGGSWQAERTALQGLHVSSLALEPQSGTLFAGTHNGGLLASRDGGRSWQRCAGIEQDEVYSLAVAHGRVYAGTEPAHLYVSEDAGQTWADLAGLCQVPGTEAWTFPAPPHVAHAKYIAPDPHDESVVYTCVEQGGLLRSTDGGRTFQLIFDAPAVDAHRIHAPAGKPGSLFLTRGDWSIGQEGIYRSKDGGSSWERLFDRSLGIGYPDATLMHPDNPDLIFVAGATGSPNAWPKLLNPGTHVARSRDGGDTWQLLTSVPPEGTMANIEAMSMNTWRGGFEIFAGTTDGEVYRTEDEGETWTTIATGLPAISKAGHYRWRARIAA